MCSSELIARDDGPTRAMRVRIRSVVASSTVLILPVYPISRQFRRPSVLRVCAGPTCGLLSLPQTRAVEKNDVVKGIKAHRVFDISELDGVTPRIIIG